MIRYFIVASLGIGIAACQVPSHKTSLDAAREMADAVMQKYDSLVHYMDALDTRTSWQYDYALLAGAIARLERYTQEPKYFQYMKDFTDYYVQKEGSIRYYRYEEYNLDKIRPGVNLFWLYRETSEPRYRAALEKLIMQLQKQPRTTEGGFWHKNIYPSQMWLDGIYMASPFMAEYGIEFQHPEWLREAVRQIRLMDEKTRDERSGLLYHAWNETAAEKWCDPETGRSRCFWSRAMGWYTMAVVDVLDFLPENDPGRKPLLDILQSTAAALVQVQDSVTGLWYQVLDQAGKPGNYAEASGTGMFVYAFAKGVRKGYLEKKYGEAAQKGFQGLTTYLLKKDTCGFPVLTAICGGCGLGGMPYRMGDYHYYITEKVVENDPKGVAPYILAGIEMYELEKRMSEAN